MEKYRHRNRHFITGTFWHEDISAQEHFRMAIFWHHGRFTMGTLKHWDILAKWYFSTCTFGTRVPMLQSLYCFADCQNVHMLKHPCPKYCCAIIFYCCNQNFHGTEIYPYWNVLVPKCPSSKQSPWWNVHAEMSGAEISPSHLWAYPVNILNTLA